MRWIGRLLRRAPELDSAQRAALGAYRSRAKPDLRTPLGLQRMAVVDVETSGLDPFNDRLISIGAITVRGGLARVDESFEVVLRQALPSPDENIVVHGIGGSAQLAGREPATALLDFLSFTDKAPVVAFNADFDCIVIERAISSVLGAKQDNIWFDVSLLLPVFFPRLATAAHTLDDWAGVFGIENHARHNAVADALATAQLLLVILAQARQEGVSSCADLITLQRDRHWLGR